MTSVAASKWGNSTAIRLPKAVVEQLGITPGQRLEVIVADGAVTFVPEQPKKITLDWIISEMKRLGFENEPETVNWGRDRGDEVIDDEYSRRR